MRRALAVILASVLLLAGMPAVAGGNHGHGYARYSYGYGHSYARNSYGYRGGYSSFHYYGGDDALAYLAVGALVGALVARPYYQQRPVYQPRPAYTRVQPHNCQPTTGTGYYRGRPAVFGGTYCTTAAGYGYILAGSEHFLGYR